MVDAKQTIRDMSLLGGKDQKKKQEIMFTSLLT
jgi:hypothetical protein